jgi:hypothetical protein
MLYACLTVLISLIFFHSKLVAQEETPSFKNVDSLTYALYFQQNWDDLIREGNAALRQNIDYYYLRMRMGIAWYAKQNYRQAIPHFEGALKFNSEDQLALEYLYFSYLFSGRQTDAKRIMPGLSETTRKNAGIEGSPLIEEIYVEGGPGIPANQKINNYWEHPKQWDTIYSSGYIYEGYIYLHGGLRINLLPWLSIYQGYSNIKAPFTQKIRYQGEFLDNFTNTTSQNEYYAHLIIGLPKGIRIIPACHLIWIEYDNRTARYDNESYQLITDTMANKRSDYVLSMAVKKDFTKFALELNGTYGEFGSDELSQIGLSAFVYPFGNLNFYTQTSLINKRQPEESSLIFYQMVGGRVFNRLWLESNFTIGNLTNYAENNGFIVYNAPEKINYKFESVVIYSLNRNLEFSLRYRLMQRENSYLYYRTFEEYDWSTIKYFYHTIIGGVKWIL